MYLLFISKKQRKELTDSSSFFNQHTRIAEPTIFWFLSLSKISLTILRTYKLLTYCYFLYVEKQHVQATVVGSTFHTIFPLQLREGFNLSKR